MSQQYLAQCPHCSATFKVQDQHLNAAGGKVRCGSCMQVFNAREQLEAKGQLHSQEKETVIERAIQNQTPARKEPPNSTKNYDSYLTDEKALEKAEEEFVFADNPEADAEDKSYTGKSSRTEDDMNTSFLDMSATRAHQFNDVLNEDTLFEVADGNSSDESWAEKMLEESDAETAQRAKPKDAGSRNKNIHIEPSFSLTDENDFSGDSNDGAEQQRRDKQPRKTESKTEFPGSHSFSNANHSHYHTLRVEPITAQRMRGKIGTLKTILWCLIGFCLIAGVFGQLAWYNFEKFVQYPQLRPFYATACNALNCTLPALVDITKVRSQNLVVRSHPTVKNSLIIDAVIVNKAAFKQPFPRLGLHFSDINNNIVAEKIFTPDEYLSGDAKGMSKMPIDTPVRLVIEIKDPGAQAVNYSISFHKAAND